MKEKILLLPANNIKRKLPANFSQADNSYFSGEVEHLLSPVYLNLYHDVKVTYAGTVFSGIKTYSESVREDYRHTLGIKYVLYNLLRRKKINALPETNFMLVYNNLCDCYYHWMTEALPRLFLIKDKIKKNKLILPDIYRKFQILSLEPFGIKEEDIFFIPKGTYVNVPELIMPSFTGVEQSYQDDLMKEMRDFYLSYYKEKNKLLPTGEKYYIKRKKSSIRHIINEEEVITCLREYGFKDLYFEDFTFEQQINISYSAKHLVSIHGAGLTNMMFMQSGTNVLEFRKEKETGYLHYYTLASSLDINYYYLFGKPEDNKVSSKEANLTIDINQLRKTIELMLQ